MSEPTITEQIQTAISAVNSQLAAATNAILQRVGWIMTSDLITGPYPIKGGTGENGEEYPVTLDGTYTDSVGPLYAPTVNARALSCAVISSDTVLTEQNHSGKILIADTAVTLTPDTALPEPNNSDYWFCQILNMSAGNVTIICPEAQTLNGGGASINISAGRSALLIKTSPTALRLFGGAA